MEGEKNFIKQELGEKTTEFEKLNVEAEEAETPGEREQKIEEASRLEGKLDELEKDLGVSEDEIMKFYEGMDDAMAKEMIDGCAEEAPEDVREDVSQGSLSKFRHWLGGAKLSQMKKARMAACILALTIGVGFLSSCSEAGEPKEKNKVEQVSKNKKDWQAELESLKQWRGEHRLELSDEYLKTMAMHPRTDKLVEIEEKRHGVSGIRKALKDISKIQQEVEQEEQKIETEEEKSSQKGIISSGKGADPAAW